MKISIKNNITECYLIASVSFYWFFTATVLNLIAISLLLIVVLQLLNQKKSTGIAIASIFLVLNLFMVLALLSELSEFTEYTSNYYQLLIVGFLYLGLNCWFSTRMIIKYTKQHTAASLENKTV